MESKKKDDNFKFIKITEACNADLGSIDIALKDVEGYRLPSAALADPEYLKAVYAKTAAENMRNWEDIPQSVTLQKLYFEISSECNLNCAMCFRNTWIDEDTGMMDFSDYEKVLADKKAMKDVHTVFLGGMGEPLIHPDVVRMVKLASGMGKNVELITNGTMLTESMASDLLDAGLYKLWISIDGFDPEIYEHIRRKSKFGMVMSNLIRFNELRSEKCSSTKLGVTFVAQQSNVNQLLEMPAFVKEYDISDINISNVIPNTPGLESEMLYSDVLDNLFWLLDVQITDYRAYNFPAMDLLRPGVEEAYETLKDIVGNTRIPENRDLKTHPYCRFINEGNCFVRWDGSVTSCMGLLHSSYTYLLSQKRKIMHYSFGNIHDSQLSDIWNSKEYTDFRKKVLNFEFSPCVTCGGCELRDSNLEDCLGNTEPVCGACLWAYGVASCP